MAYVQDFLARESDAETRERVLAFLGRLADDPFRVPAMPVVEGPRITPRYHYVEGTDVIVTWFVDEEQRVVRLRPIVRLGD